MTTQPPPESAETAPAQRPECPHGVGLCTASCPSKQPAPVATDTQAREAYDRRTLATRVAVAKLHDANPEHALPGELPSSRYSPMAVAFASAEGKMRVSPSGLGFIRDLKPDVPGEEPATTAPSGDAEVSHEQARSFVSEMAHEVGWYAVGRKLEAYISQQEANSNALAQALGVDYRGESFSWLLGLVRRDARAAGAVLSDASTPAPAGDLDPVALSQHMTAEDFAAISSIDDEDTQTREAWAGTVDHMSPLERVLAAQCRVESALDATTPAHADTQARSVSTARPLTAADLMPATTAPAGDAEVSHEQARSVIREAWGVPVSLKDCLLKLRRYADQCEARQQQAEKRIAEYKASEADWRERLRAAQSALQGKYKAIAELQEAITEDRRVQRVRAADAEIALMEEQSLTADLRLKLEEAELSALSLAADVQRAEAHGRVSERDSHMVRAAQRILGGAPAQPPPANPLTESEDERIVDELMARRARGLTETKPLTPDDVRTIAREVIAEVAERADASTDDGFLFERLAMAAKEESGV